MGFSVHEGIMDHGEIKTSAMNELKRVFRPEFLNRIDDIVVFHSLAKKEVSAIFDIMMSEVALRLFENNIFIEISKKAKEMLIDKGYDVKFGARPLRRTIQNEIEDQLSMEILKGNFKSGDHILVEYRNDRIKFRKKQAPKIDEAHVK